MLICVIFLHSIAANIRILFTFQPQCKICLKTFKREWNLHNHLAVHKTSRKKAKCPNCSKDFFDVPNLRLHFARFHPSELLDIGQLIWKPTKKKHAANLPTCAVCKRSFPKSYNLKMHLLAYHTENRLKIACQFCGKLCSNISTLQRHQEFNCSKKDVDFNHEMVNILSFDCVSSHL